MTCNCARFPKPHNKQRLCGIGFNEFLGEVQHRLILAGYAPPVWPDAKIRDQGDLDDALDSCVQWCAARLDACGEADQRDAARYRWLGYRATLDSGINAGERADRFWQFPILTEVAGQSLDATIDAAMSAQSDKEERK